MGESADPAGQQLDALMPGILDGLAATSAARDKALEICRRVIRLSANTIRAVHREDFDTARELLAQATTARDEATALLRPHPDIYYAGFLHDAQKEFAEAAITLALISGESMPGPADLSVEHPAYLNGMAEAVGELRRCILDRLRRGNLDGTEALLDAMDAVYSALVTVDFPDAMTGNLRRTTDQTRGILERTRGDLTMAMVQWKAMSDERGRSNE